MVLNKADVVTIPKYIIILVMPAIISGIIGYAGYRFAAGKSEKTLEITVKDVEILKKDKVGTIEFGIIQAQLNRIEIKIDNHTSK